MGCEHDFFSGHKGRRGAVARGGLKEPNELQHIELLVPREEQEEQDEEEEDIHRPPRRSWHIPHDRR